MSWARSNIESPDVSWLLNVTQNSQISTYLVYVFLVNLDKNNIKKISHASTALLWVHMQNFVVIHHCIFRIANIISMNSIFCGVIPEYNKPQGWQSDSCGLMIFIVFIMHSTLTSLLNVFLTLWPSVDRKKRVLTSLEETFLMYFLCRTNISNLIKIVPLLFSIKIVWCCLSFKRSN